VEQKNRNGVLRTGLIGAVIAAVCCVTPLLVVLLGLAGLGALAGYLDYVLLPALVIFLAIIVYGLYRRRSLSADPCCARPPKDQDAPQKRGNGVHECQ